MNKRSLLILTLAASVFATSCKKQDSLTSENTATALAPEWKSAGKWTAATTDDATVYSSTITDKALTSPIVENGLVLVYMKTASGVQSLPYQETGTSGTYWYYQVSQNGIELNAETKGQVSVEDNKNFNYFIVSAEKLKTLEAQGHTQMELMSLTYENAAALLK